MMAGPHIDAIKRPFLMPFQMQRKFFQRKLYFLEIHINREDRDSLFIKNQNNDMYSNYIATYLYNICLLYGFMFYK